MAKSLCKYRSAEIAERFPQICQIIGTPKYVCTSCARAASDKGHLCKPLAIKKTDKRTDEVTLPVLGEDVPQREPAALEKDKVSAKKQAKQMKSLKKLAKKKAKRLKQAMKAARRYDKVLDKVRESLQSS